MPTDCGDGGCNTIYSEQRNIGTIGRSLVCSAGGHVRTMYTGSYSKLIWIVRQGDLLNPPVYAHISICIHVLHMEAVRKITLVFILCSYICLCLWGEHTQDNFLFTSVKENC